MLSGIPDAKNKIVRVEEESSACEVASISGFSINNNICTGFKQKDQTKPKLLKNPKPFGSINKAKRQRAVVTLENFTANENLADAIKDLTFNLGYEV